MAYGTASPVAAALSWKRVGGPLPAVVAACGFKVFRFVDRSRREEVIFVSGRVRATYVAADLLREGVRPPRPGLRVSGDSYPRMGLTWITFESSVSAVY